MTFIGRTKILLISDETGDNPLGIVSEVVVLPSSDDREGRLVFRGPVSFKDRSKNHLLSVVLPLVDRITDTLGLPRRSYEASVVNPGAAASSGIGMEIGGFSADLPVFLALLSSATRIALRPDIASTGHIASLGGDIASVRGIPAKLDAALKSSEISGILIPDLDKDGSLKVLTPGEYRAAKESLLAHRGEIAIYPANDVHDAVKILMTDDSIVMGSLNSGFFDKRISLTSAPDAVNKTALLLSEGNEERFWSALDHLLLNRKIEEAKLLLQTYAHFFIQNQRYPENFGEALYRLVLSLPPLTRRMDDLFPLLSMDLCIKLAQHAKTSDHNDVRRLHKAAFGEGLEGVSRPKEQGPPSPAPESEIFEGILSEISEENLAIKIGHPLDGARASYVTDAVTVKDGFEFNEAVTAFYGHVFRHTGSPAGQMQKSALSADAIDLVERAFQQKGGYKSALFEGTHGINGGMRLVFDAMTERLKQDGKEKHVNWVFKKAIEPLEWNAKARLMKMTLEKIGLGAPADLQALPPEQLASHCDEVIGIFAKSLSEVKELIRRL
ncbi:MAG: Lon protease C-terminal proteolytic domain [Deltaproteobacteria bacterium]|nr:Lon protease C-terminal proteolytic domain [Deltaproteobacteria bacterium]